jgi:hypothetical protein
MVLHDDHVVRIIIRGKKKLKEIFEGTLVSLDGFGVKLNLRVGPALGPIVHGFRAPRYSTYGNGDSKI